MQEYLNHYLYQLAKKIPSEFKSNVSKDYQHVRQVIVEMICKFA